MPTYFARKAGNINAADVWATTPSGTAAAVAFASGDVLMANSFAITVNISTNLGSTGQVRNDATSGATAGGSFALSDGVTLTANVFAGATGCVSTTGTVSASVVGNLTGGTGAGRAIAHSSSGLLTVTATTIAAGSASDTQGIYASSSGSTSITCTSLSAGTGSINTPGIRLDSTGSHSFSGNATGGSLAGCHAYQLNAATTATLTGNFTGGSNATAYGAINSVLGTLNIVGQAIGGTAAPGAHNTSTGTISVTRAVGNGFGPGSTGLTAAAGVNNAALGVVEFQEIQFGSRGQPPLTGTGFRLKKASTNVAVFSYCDTEGAKTLIDATQNAAMPAASNVRSGVSYASGALSGSCAVPAAGSVSLGVPVDAGFGTAVLTPEAVWGHATRTITGGLVDTATTLTNAPTVPSVVQIREEMDANSTKLANLDASISSRLATSGYTAPTSAPSVSDIRTELSVELGRLDASVSSRLASASYTAPANSDISAIKSKTDSLPASPAAVADIPTTAQIATAVEGSLLNEADGQAVLNAIVGAIGNTNLSEVSLVAAVRADLERTGGKIDSIPTSSAPSASTVAGAVRTELATELGRIDAAVSSRLAPSGTLATVTTLTNAPTVPTAAAIADEVRVELATELARIDAPISGAGNAPSAATVATAVRSELATELARVDQAVSSRLAGSAYTAPANSDVAAIKVKTDALVVERLANVATTAIVGNLIAQANS